MISINTNTTAQYVFNQTRLNNLVFGEKTERLTSGARVNRGVDDPSGLAISVGMTAQIRGLLTDIANVQDGIYMLNFLDGVFDVTQDILMRMKDIALRLANEAVVSTVVDPTEVVPSQARMLYDEYYGLAQLVVKFFNTQVGGQRFLPYIQFNGKPILMNDFYIEPGTGNLIPHYHLPSGEDLQVGPDNDSSHRIEVKTMWMEQVFDDFEAFFQPPLPNFTMSWFSGFGRTQASNIADKIDKISEARVEVGTIINRLRKTLNDISAQYINVSAGRSRILDADMAVEITELAKNQIRTQTTVAMASQANAVPLIAMPLLEAIYAGLAPTPETETSQ
ncbi:MAG: flagellin [bacterium]